MARRKGVLHDVRELFKIHARWTGEDIVPIIDFATSLVFGNLAFNTHRLMLPIWGHVIGPSGSGKSLLVDSFSNVEGIFKLDALSDKALVSGYRDKDNPDVDMSLLKDLDNKVVISSDFSSFLKNSNPEARAAQEALFRTGYDQSFTKKFANIEEPVVYDVRFGFLTAITPDIDFARGHTANLGERFLACRFRPSKDPRRRLADAAWARSNGRLSGDWKGEVREALREIILGALGNVPDGTRHPLDLVTIPDRIGESLDTMAIVVASARTNPTEYGPTDPEEGNRLTQQLAQLCGVRSYLAGSSVMGEEDVRFAARVLSDTTPAHVSRLCRLLIGKDIDEFKERVAISRGVGKLPYGLLERIFNQYEYAGLIESAGIRKVRFSEFYREQLRSLPLWRTT